MATDPAVILIAVILMNYYVTTFTVWFGHWFSHLKKSPLAPFHVAGHHVFYPDSHHILSQKFIYGQGKKSSIYSLLPWLIVQSLGQFIWFSGTNYMVCLATEIALVVVFSQLHGEFHLRGSRLERFAWFRRARQHHALHHDRDVNYMVGDHFWDRLFGTYMPPAEVKVNARRRAKVTVKLASPKQVELKVFHRKGSGGLEG